MWPFGRVERAALALVEQAPDGIEASTLEQRLAERFPRTGAAGIARTVAQLDSRHPQRLYRWGTKLLLAAKAADGGQDERALEFAYYAPLKAYLEARLQLNHAFAVAPKQSAAGKFSNPDLLGATKPLPELRPYVQPQLIAVEVKARFGSAAKAAEKSFEAFAQAVSYKTFAHKVLIAVPHLPEGRTKYLLVQRAAHYGIGIVFFDEDVSAPNFVLHAGPRASEPDVQALNDYVTQLKVSDAEVYRQIFG